MRIVDFWQGCATSRLFVSYLRHLGCDVIFTNDRQQIGLACGFVAAQVSTDLLGVSDDWRACGVSRAVEQDWVTLGNGILGIAGTGTDFIGIASVVQLVSSWWNAELGVVNEQYAFDPLRGSHATRGWLEPPSS